jgi:hypothetical protein
MALSDSDLLFQSFDISMFDEEGIEHPLASPDAADAAAAAVAAAVLDLSCYEPMLASDNLLHVPAALDEGNGYLLLELPEVVPSPPPLAVDDQQLPTTSHPDWPLWEEGCYDEQSDTSEDDEDEQLTVEDAMGRLDLLATTHAADMLELEEDFRENQRRLEQKFEASKVKIFGKLEAALAVRANKVKPRRLTMFTLFHSQSFSGQAPSTTSGDPQRFTDQDVPTAHGDALGAEAAGGGCGEGSGRTCHQVHDIQAFRPCG